MLTLFPSTTEVGGVTKETVVSKSRVSSFSIRSNRRSRTGLDRLRLTKPSLRNVSSHKAKGRSM